MNDKIAARRRRATARALHASDNHVARQAVFVSSLALGLLTIMLLTY